MRIRFKRIDHVQLSIPAGAEEAARMFYGGDLGLEEIEKPEALKRNGGLWYKVADAQLHLGIDERRQKTKSHPAFEVEGLEEIKAYFQKAGIEVQEETQVPGVARFSFYDPFGNRIEFLEKDLAKSRLEGE
jgi:catechol 2,3-dioxygenase-like lactoylglutathione lyase family enzyme